jgi:hypothetical protein
VAIYDIAPLTLEEALAAQRLIMESPDPSAMLARWIAADASNVWTNYLLDLQADGLNSFEHGMSKTIEGIGRIVEDQVLPASRRDTLRDLPQNIERLADALQAVADRDLLSLAVDVQDEHTAVRVEEGVILDL